MTEAWSRRPATVLTQILRNIQSLITHRVSLLEGDALINDDLIVENAVKECVGKKLKLATSGNRTRASRVAGENSTTEPTLPV